MHPTPANGMPAFELAPLQHWPIAAVLAVQAKAYAAHLVEQGAVLQGKVQAALPGQPLSWGIALAHAPDVLCGYAIACPWQRALAPGLDQAGRLPTAHLADCLYVHDIAIDPAHRGHKLAEKLMQQVLQQGRAYGWQQAVLVAVQGAHRYWARCGFAAVPAADAPDISGFGSDAVWMQRAL